jgi:hypothetical protein
VSVIGPAHNSSAELLKRMAVRKLQRALEIR